MNYTYNTKQKLPQLCLILQLYLENKMYKTNFENKIELITLTIQ